MLGRGVGHLLANTSGFPFSTHLQAYCIKLLLYSPESMPCIFHMYTPSATPRPAMPVLQQGNHSSGLEHQGQRTFMPQIDVPHAKAHNTNPAEQKGSQFRL